MKKVVIPSSFVGTPLYYALIHSSNYDLIIDYAGYFYKQTFRNRTNILTPQGIKPLIVPVIGGRKNGIPLKNIKIDYTENWIHKHLKSLETYYFSSAFYEILIDEIAGVYNKNYTFLWELNSAFTTFFSELLNLSPYYSENFDDLIECDNECIDLR